MSKVFIDDGRLAIELPDGFEVLTPEQLQSMHGIEYAQMWGARSEGRHLSLTVIWKDSNEWLTKLASDKSLAKRVEKAFAKKYRAQSYRRGEFFAANMANRAVHGFGCYFEVEGVPFECEVRVFKDGARCYTLYYYTREESAQQNRSAYESMLASLSL